MTRRKVAAVTLAFLSTIAGAAINHALSSPIGADVNWPSHGGDSGETGFSPLARINTANIGRLGLVWALDLDNEVSLEATPLEIGSTLYFTGSYSAVYAVDAVTGKLKWTYDPRVWAFNPAKMRNNLPVNRGVAYARGRIFAGTWDGRLIALDARTGKLLWSTETVARNDNRTISGAPRVFNDKVIIGNASGDAGLRGYVTAYAQATGKEIWRFYTTPASPQENRGDAAMEMAATTWTGQYWKTGTGGAVWNGMTFDPALNRIYIGTGNGGPYNPRVRSPGGGDNLFISSIVALNADTGGYVWHCQFNPRDAWDYDATADILLADLTIDGKPRKVLMQAPKNGFFYVIDPETGKLLSAAKTGKVNWADHIDLKTGRPVEEANVRYEHGDSIVYPGALGAHNWQDMSFNPKTGLVYIPYMQLGARYTTRTFPDFFSFGTMTFVPYEAGDGDGKGALLAWDPVAQQARWKVPVETLWNGGTLTTAGNLVFQGTGDGYFTAYDAASGRRLWRFNAGLGIVAAPISYSVNDTQYVSVLVGYGGITLGSAMNAGWKFGAQPRRVLTFALDGRMALPSSLPRDMKVHALDVPALRLGKSSVTEGQGLSRLCLGCHGRAFEGTGSPAPDLRESRAALSEDAMWSVVHDGALIQHGMPRFDMLTREQIHALYMYLRATAREALGKRTPLDDQGWTRD